MSNIKDSVLDPDGNRFVYRLVSSRLERRRWESSVWFDVTGPMFAVMTPSELRHVADVLERKSA